MKLLLIADLDSIHVYNYVKNVLAHTQFTIVAFDIKGSISRVRDNFKSYYIDNNITLVDGTDIGLIKKGWYLKYSIDLIKRLKSLGYFDCVHLKGVYNYLAPALFLRRNQFGHIILTYWGSDLFRASRFMLLQTLPLVHVADRMTFITDDMRKYFQNVSFLRKYISQSTIIDYGNMFYEKIDDFEKNDQRQIKESLGLDSQKITVSIGYHGRPQMQQFKAINAIIQSGSSLLNNVQFCFPVYGITDSDLSNLKNCLTNSNICYRLFEGFMDENTVSKYRVATDVFIHPQTSDALSCAMLEHLYAGNVVINGEWLNYSSLDDNNVKYITFKDFDNLPTILDTVLLNLVEESRLAKGNKKIISRISSWAALRKPWLELYNFNYE